MTWSLLGGLMLPAADAAKENKVKSTKNSGDSGNCSEAEEEQNTNRATTLEFQLTQSLLSQVRADKNNADANSGKQAYKDLPRMNFIINGKTISKDFVGQLCDRYNQELQSNKRQVAKHVLIEMFKHAKAEVPDDHILKELITNCNQAGYDGSLFMQLFPIFFEHNLQLPDANDRKISIICNSQDSLNIQYCPSMPVKQQDTKIEICRLDAILEFTLKSQNGKVEYKDGKVTLTIPEQLKDYKAGSKSLLGDINRHFEDADNAVVESLIANIDEGPKSFVAGSPAEVDSDVDNSFDIIPKSLAFDKLVDIINKAKNGDYNDLNEVINNIREDKENDRFITDLNRGNFDNFCSQQLNLTEHMYEVLSNHKYKGNYNDTVKELVLLAIAANDTLVERCVKMHEGILFTQDEDLDRLLLGAGGQGYIKALLEFLEEKQSRVLSWNNICEKLKRASSIGNQECVEAILKRFEDTESRDPAIKLLHYAVEKGDYDLVDSLIKNGADVNIQDRDDKTALHYAVSSYGDIQNVNKMVMLLVESGANIDIQDSDGKTVLHYAASSKDEIVRLLLKEGADETIKDRSGKTFLGMVASGTKSFLLNVLRPEGLLHHAVMEGNIDRVKRLLEKGENVNAENNDGKSPLSVAIERDCLEIVKLFLKEKVEIGEEEVKKAIEKGNLEVIELLESKDAVITEKAIQYARGVYEKCEEDKKQAHSSVLMFLVNIHIRAAIKQGDLERIKSLVNECTVIARETIQCARDACKICKEDKKQAHLDVLTFLVDIHNEQLFKKAIEQGDLKKIKSYVDKGTVISGEIIQCARDACKICKEDKKQAHLSVLTFLMKTSKDQFKEAIESSNLEGVKLFVGKGAVITKEIIQRVELFYNTRKKERVYIANYPGGMKAEKQNRTEILNFLKDNVRSNSNLVNETATSSQVVNEEDNNQSKNPGLESAGSQQTEKNIVDRGKNIMNNKEGSTEELISNSFEEGEVSKGNGSNNRHSSRKLSNGTRASTDVKNSKSNNATSTLEIMLKKVSQELRAQFSLDSRQVEAILKAVVSEGKKAISKSDNKRKVLDTILQGKELFCAVLQKNLQDVRMQTTILLKNSFQGRPSIEVMKFILGEAVNLVEGFQPLEKVQNIEKHLKKFLLGVELFCAVLQEKPQDVQMHVEQLCGNCVVDIYEKQSILDKAKRLTNGLKEEKIKKQITKCLEDVSDKSKTPEVPSVTQGTGINGKQSANSSSGSVTEPFVQSAPPKNASLYVSNTEDVTNSEDIPVVNGASNDGVFELEVKSNQSNRDDECSSTFSDASDASTIKAAGDFEDEQPNSSPLLPQSSVSGDEHSGSSPSFINVPTSDEGDTDNSNSEVSSEDITKEDPTLKGSSSLQDIQPEILVPSSSVSPDVGNVSTAENINDNMVASKNSEQEDDAQDNTSINTSEESGEDSYAAKVEDTKASANAAITIPEKVDSTVSSIDGNEEKQASLSDEVFYDAEESVLGTTNSKDGSTLEGDSDKQEPQPKSVPTPLVAKENSGQVNNVQSNGRQSDNQNNKDIQDVSATISDQVTPVSSDTENNKVEKSGVSLQSSGYVDNSTVLSFVDREHVIHVDAQVSGDVSCLVKTISEDTDEVASNQNGVLLLEAQPMVQSYDSSEKGNTNLQRAGDSSVGVVSKNGSDQLPADNLEQNSKGVDDSSVSVQSIGMVISQSNSASTITLDDHKPLMKDIENDNDPSEEDNDSPQNIKKSTLSTIVVSTLVVAAVASIAISVYLEMLAMGIAVGACCLVAAAVIYCCTPKSQVENSEVEKPFNTGKVPTAVHV